MISVELVLGTAQLVNRYGALGESVHALGEEVRAFLNSAADLGITAFDTAPAYEGAEAAIGEADTSLPVHTKLDQSLSPEQSLRGSLLRLSRESVALAYLHDPEAATMDGGAAIDQAAVLVGELTGALGASVYSVTACRAAMDHEHITVVQIPVNPLKRDVVEAISIEQRSGVRVFARSLLGQGLLAVAPHRLPTGVAHLAPAIAAFQMACRVIQRSPVEVCLLWARDHPSLDGMVVGAASLAQLSELATCLALPPLSKDERDLIDAIQLPSPNSFDPRTWS